MRLSFLEPIQENNLKSCRKISTKRIEGNNQNNIIEKGNKVD